MGPLRQGPPPLCGSSSAWVGGRQADARRPGLARGKLGGAEPAGVCDPPGCARVLSPAAHHCVSPLLALAPHPPGLTASVRRWKIPRRHKPAAPSALGETEA